MRKHIIIATRGSRLALWQANHVKDLLEGLNSNIAASLNIIKTRGDIIQDAPLAKIGGKGLFVKEIEEALLAGRADIAVHSIKDVPMKLPSGLILGCVPKRDACTDCFLSMFYPSIQALPQNSHVGTSSLRRQAQLLAMRPDLRVSALRGNIDTRLSKLEAGDYDAIILATAGLYRLDLQARFMLPLEANEFIPAVGQGALGIECLEDNYDLLVPLASLEDRDTRVCVNAERAFMSAIEGGCQIPAGCHAIMIDDETISCQGFVADTDGAVILRAEKQGDASLAEQIGADVAREILANGGKSILQKLTK